MYSPNKHECALRFGISRSAKVLCLTEQTGVWAVVQFPEFIEGPVLIQVNVFDMLSVGTGNLDARSCDKRCLSVLRIVIRRCIAETEHKRRTSQG